MFGPIASRPTSSTLDQSQTWGHMVTWFWVGLEGGVTPRSQEGHLKVTCRFNQLQIGEDSLFLLVLLQFNSIEMSMVVETRLDSSMEIYQNTQKSNRVNIRARGIIPHQITLMSTLSHMAKMDQITQRLSCLDQWPVLRIHMMKPNMVTWFGVGLNRDGTWWS